MNIVFKPDTSDYDIVGTMATMEVGDVFQFESESVVEDLMTASKYAVLITTSNSLVVSFDSYTNLITIERNENKTPHNGNDGHSDNCTGNLWQCLLDLHRSGHGSPV